MLPDRSELKNGLLKILYSSKKFSLDASTVYDLGLEYYPDITDEERLVPYHKTTPKYQNEVQHAIKELKDEGLVLRHFTEGVSVGVWQLSKLGIEKAKLLFNSVYLIDPHLEESIEEHLGILQEENDFLEGEKKQRLSSYYERDKKLRLRAIQVHGIKCMVCDFDFEKVYGEIGNNFIEVHHIVPISTFKEEHKVNAATDMIPLCANCHRMIHQKNTLSVDKLREIIKQNKSTI